MERYKTLAQRVDLSQLRWLERKCLEHGDPVNLLLHVLGIALIVYGLWINVTAWVGIGIILLIIGHIYVSSTSKNKSQRNRKK